MIFPLQIFFCNEIFLRILQKFSEKYFLGKIFRKKFFWAKILPPYVQDSPWNLPLKFRQNRVSNCWDTTDKEFLWGGLRLCGWNSHFRVNPSYMLFHTFLKHPWDTWYIALKHPYNYISSLGLKNSLVTDGHTDTRTDELSDTVTSWAAHRS